MAEHVDVIVVGAGLSGIDAAYHLQTRCPDRSYVILEARDSIGGTWDLFRYPGIRSDSDMHTLGFPFHPWRGKAAIAGGETIRDYICETAQRFGIDRSIRFGQRVIRADWSTPEVRWTLEVEAQGERRTMTCDFLYLCAGYYDYARGHAPAFAGSEAFSGRIVHPQFWPDDLDVAGREVVVIGSGATAVTLVPALARTAAHVTMLQRSPTYVVSRPARDAIADRLHRWLPSRVAGRMVRWKNVGMGMFFYRLARRRPQQVKQRLIGMVRDQLGPAYDVETHFTPRYNPWDQRLCLVPDADLFAALRDGRAGVETGTIDRFTEHGIRLQSGKELPADVVVTATGLELALFGKIVMHVDGRAVVARDTVQYKGMMLSDVPNMAFTFGYTNASWTLKADLVARYVCRLLNAMRRRGVRQVTPRTGKQVIAPQPAVDFSSGYIQRAADQLPPQGDRAPWRLHQNYARDVMMLRFGAIDDALEFSNPAAAAQAAA